MTEIKKRNPLLLCFHSLRSVRCSVSVRLVVLASVWRLEQATTTCAPSYLRGPLAKAGRYSPETRYWR